MHFVITCVDKPGQPELRQANRAEHLNYLADHSERILAAGPTLSDDGEVPTGSVLIMDFEDAEAAARFAAGDPYSLAGVFEDVTIKPWKKVYPKG